MNPFEYKPSYERNLPHIQPPEATLFVTFRLDGSIPEPVLEQWRIEKKRLEMTLLRWAATSPAGTIPNPEEVAEDKLKFHRRWFKKFEDVLDGAATGPLWLKEERVADIVDEALRHRDGKVYRLDAFCVMPNHVHTVFAPFLTEEMARELAERAIRRKISVQAAEEIRLAAEAEQGLERVFTNVPFGLPQEPLPMVNNPDALPDLPSVQEFAQHIGTRLPRARVAALTFDRLDPVQGMEVKAGCDLKFRLRIEPNDKGKRDDALVEQLNEILKEVSADLRLEG